MTDIRTSGPAVPASKAVVPETVEGEFTFLFTDIVSSTEFWDRVPAEMASALARHDEILAAAVDRHRGQRVKHTGDGVMAVFEQPIDAVRSGIEAQRELAAVAWHADAVIEARMGIHRGAAVLRSGDYFGTSPSRCARIMAVAHGGQVLLSNDVAEAVAPVVGQHAIELRTLGEHMLRGLSRPEHIHQATGPGMRNEFPPLAGAVSFMPVPLAGTPLIGREPEIKTVRDAIGRHPLVTITGPAGVGKTRLAARVATLERDEAARAVAYVDLEPADANVVGRTLAAGIGAPRNGDEQPVDAVVRALAQTQVLVVLDNAEHVIGAVGSVLEPVLAQCGGVRILVTSQAPIGLPGEQVIQLDPLGTEPGGAALELFADRAREIDPSFEIDKHREAVTALCSTLDGLPLAVELAAARVRMLEPREILERLDRRLEFLRVPEGHPRAKRGGTLGAVIGWSYELLEPPEQRLFARLGVFRGPFTLAAAEAIAAFPPVESWDIADLLDRLLQRSLIAVDGRGALRRFRLLESITAFAVDRLGASGDEHETRARHAQHYTAALAELDPLDDAAVDMLDIDSTNVRAAATWSATTAPRPTAELLLLKYRSLCDVGWQDDLLAWFRLVSDRKPFDTDVDHALLLQRIGQLSMATGQHLDVGRRALEGALQIAESGQDARQVVAARLRLATLLSLYPASLDIDAASEHIEAIENAPEDAYGPWTDARVHSCAAMVHLHQRESASGARRAHCAQEAALRAGLVPLAANAKAIEGAHLAYGGQIAAGLAQVEEAWRDALDAGDTRVASSAAWLRGYASILLADPTDARSWFERELASGRAEPNPAIRRSLRANLGIAMVLSGHLDEADEIARDSIAINGTLLQPLLRFARSGFEEIDPDTPALLRRLRDIGDRNEYTALTGWTGRFQSSIGQAAAAREMLAEALELALREPACPYYEVPIRAELAMLGDATQLPRLRDLATTHPLRGLEARIRLAGAVTGPPDDAEIRFAEALQIAGTYMLAVDRIDILMRRARHRHRVGDEAARDADVEEINRSLRGSGRRSEWQPKESTS